MELIKQRLGRYKSVYTMCDTREEIIDVIVPDANPDYEREICTFAVCRVIDKSILSGGIRVSGEVKATVFYDAQASESMYTINAATPFSCSYDVPNALPDDIFRIKMSVLSAESEIVNSRKIRIKIKLSAEINTYRMENIEICEDAYSEQGEGINVKTEDITRISCVDIAERAIAFTEEIRLSDDEVIMFSPVIRWDCEWKTEEIKVLQNKLMVRGIAALKVHGCIAENAEIKSRDYVLPFSQVIECKNSCDTDKVDVNISNNCCFVSIVTKEDGNSYLKCEAYAEAAAFVYREASGKMLLDIYSTEYETDYNTTPIYLENRINDFYAEIPCEGKFDTQEAVGRILDKNINCMCNAGNDNISCTMYATILYEDGLGLMRTARTVIGINADKPENIEPCSIICKAEKITVSNDSSGICISFTVVLNAKIKSGAVYEQISSCNIDTNKRRQRTTKGNLILRYPDKNESVWSIAKQYGTTMTAIMSANDINDECEITEQKLIIIPFVR